MAKNQVAYNNAWFLLAVTRIMLGFVFLWAFIDKVFGLGVATTSGKAWINGGSPTAGFLQSVEGPFRPIFTTLAQLGSLADWLFMLGLLGVGVALLCGTGLRIAAVAGATLLLLMWLAELPLQTNPFIDEHLIYTILLFAFAAAPRKVSLVDWWVGHPYVKKNPWLW